MIIMEIVPKLTVVIPCHTINDELEEMAWDCAKSYRHQCDELIVVEDGGLCSYDLRELSDIYIYLNNRLGFTKAVNCGWKLSSGDYTAIVNSDTLLRQGNIRSLCVPGKVISPALSSTSDRHPNVIRGPFFVVPQNIKQQYGMLDERFYMYWSDTDYGRRTKDLFELNNGVEIYHQSGATIKKASNNPHEEWSIKDQQLYLEKWGDLGTI